MQPLSLIVSDGLKWTMNQREKTASGKIPLLGQLDRGKFGGKYAHGVRDRTVYPKSEREDFSRLVVRVAVPQRFSDLKATPHIMMKSFRKVVLKLKQQNHWGVFLK